MANQTGVLYFATDACGYAQNSTRCLMDADCNNQGSYMGCQANSAGNGTAYGCQCYGYYGFQCDEDARAAGLPMQCAQVTECQIAIILPFVLLLFGAFWLDVLLVRTIRVVLGNKGGKYDLMEIRNLTTLLLLVASLGWSFLSLAVLNAALGGDKHLAVEHHIIPVVGSFVMVTGYVGIVNIAVVWRVVHNPLLYSKLYHVLH